MKKKLFILALITSNFSNIATQKINIQYIAELQYDMRKETNIANLLTINANLTSEQLHLWKNGMFNYSSKCIFKTGENRIANDLQVFSNIENANRSYCLAVLGYTHTYRAMKLFAGIRNVNEDYFITPYTSLFTNSSCGIYPTISANYPLPNYPFSAMCLHAEFQLKENWQIKNCLYNGITYEPLKKGTSLFAFRPSKDGIFNMTELTYTTNSENNGLYSGGIALHSRMYHNHEDRDQAEKKPQKKKMNYSWWTSLEQTIYRSGQKEIGLLAQYSMAPPRKNECGKYAGIGMIFTGFLLNEREDQLGLFVNQATFSSNQETAAEITWITSLNKNFSLQPAFHFIKNGSGTYTVGVIRVMYTFN